VLSTFASAGRTWTTSTFRHIVAATSQYMRSGFVSGDGREVADGGGVTDLLGRHIVVGSPSAFGADDWLISHI